MKPRVLVLRAGEPAPELRAHAGDYVDWFAGALGPEVELVPVAAWRGEALPPLSGFDGVLMTGSPLSVTDYDRQPWMARAGACLLDAAGEGLPVLGVCFGHQLVARALGGTVTKNPRGREIGTIELRLTEAGRAHPLLGTLAPLRFHATHEDAVRELPRSATLLAENAFGVQAFAFGPRGLAVQFHPELDAARMRALIESRAAPLRTEGIYARALEGVQETSAGRELLARWRAGLLERSRRTRSGRAPG